VEIAEGKGVGKDALAGAVTSQAEAAFTEYLMSGLVTQQQVDQQLAAYKAFVEQLITSKGLSPLAGGMYGDGTSMASNPFMYDPLGYYGLSNGSCGGTGTTGMGGTGTMGGMGGMSSASGMCPGMIGTMGMGMYDMSAAAQVTLLTMKAEGSVVDESLPASVDTAAKRLQVDLNAAPKRTLVFSMDMGNGYINGLDYDTKPLTISSTLGTYEVWQLVNPTCMDHPFHLHMTSFQVLAVVGGDVDYARIYTTTPAQKDTVVVPRMGSATILVPVQDYDGISMFHCHILEHEDIGMMGQWQIGGPGAGGTTGNSGDGSTTTTGMAPMTP
jgi:FtsP/CotA-like multicopper oxidase with cupredoxin domain